MRSRASPSLCPCPPRKYRATSLRARTAWVMSYGSTGSNYISAQRALFPYLAADGFGELGSVRAAAQIPRPDGSVREHAAERAADSFRGVALADMVQHEEARQ